MIILAGIVFTVVVWWLAVVLLGGVLGLLCRPVARRLRAGWRRRRARREEDLVGAGRSGPGARLPEPSSDWWPEFERQFRAHVSARDRGSYRAGDRGSDRGGDRGH